jgi:hypothetical protein
MSDRHIHIISFDIPYPPNYGGVIDVYHKLRALHQQGVRVHLHCFEYNRSKAPELSSYCESIHYYRRITGIRSAFSLKPYIVISRRSPELLNNLMQDDYPILFEGLHSCYLLDHPALKDRKKIYRESNIEHHYYFNLFKAEKNLAKKFYFLLASLKLRMFEKILEHANMMLAVSQKDSDYLKKKFPNRNIIYLPSFHANDQMNVKPGRGDFILYHGNLSVAENYEAASFLVKQVFTRTGHRLIIAGLNPPQFLIKLVSKHPNVEMATNPTDHELFGLISNAHINLLITFQATGLKLKLLNTLYKGRFTLVNDMMLNGTGLDDVCRIANTPSEILKVIDELSDKEIMEQEIRQRAELLSKDYSNQLNAKKLIEYIF